MRTALLTGVALAAMPLLSGCADGPATVEGRLLGKTEHDVRQLLGLPKEARDLTPAIQRSDALSSDTVVRWAESNSFRELDYPQHDLTVCLNKNGEVYLVRRR